jgi:hypothetical protein
VTATPITTFVPLEEDYSVPTGSRRLLSEEALESVPPPSYLIDGWMIDDSFTFVAGVPNSGKSLVAIDWAMCLARGYPWRGREVQRRKVLYLTSEGTASFRGRLEVWRLATGEDVAPGWISFCFDPMVLGSDIPDDQQMVADHAWVEAQVQAMGVRMLVIDPFANYYRGPANTDVSSFTNWCLSLNRKGVSVLVTHHESKSRDHKGGGLVMRNSSMLAGAADNVYVMKPTWHEGEDRAGLAHTTLEAQKVKDGEYPAPITFTLQQLEADGAPVRLDGEPGTSVVLRYEHSRHDRPDAERTEKLLAAITAEPGLSTNDLVAAVGGKRAKVLFELNRLAQLGRVENRGVPVGKGGRTKAAWYLLGDQVEEL